MATDNKELIAELRDWMEGCGNAPLMLLQADVEELRTLLIKAADALEAAERGVVDLEQFRPASASEEREDSHCGYLVNGTDFFYPDFPESEWGKYRSVHPVYFHPAPASGEGQQGHDSELRKGARAIVGFLRDNEWADLLARDPDLSALEAEVRSLATQQQAGQAVAPAFYLKRFDAEYIEKADINQCQTILYKSAPAGNSVPYYTTPQTHDGYVPMPEQCTYQMAEAMGITWEGGPGFPERYRALRAYIAASEASGGEGGNA